MAVTNSYRYLLKTGSQRLVPLADELALLDQFLSLATLRYAEGSSVDVQIDARSAGRRQIPPVVLPELLENAVKHNEVSSDNQLQKLGNGRRKRCKIEGSCDAFCPRSDSSRHCCAR